MTERERQINQSLHALEEAHRLGRLSREDFRSRRRFLLGTLYDSHGITARNAIARPHNAPSPRAAAPPRNDQSTPGQDSPTTWLPGRPALAWKHVAMFGAGVVLCALLFYWLLSAG
ncbi:MAG TPA: hypothetical protein VGC19_05930 [Rhodanobacter sp.]